MASEGFKRKLTSIFSADAVTYKLLATDNESHTVKTITAYREIMNFLIKQNKNVPWITSEI